MDRKIDIRRVTYIRSNRGHLHVRLRHLLLHDLPQDVDGQLLRLRQGQVVSILLLQCSLGVLRARSDRLGLVLQVGARGVGEEQLGALVVEARDQQSHAVRPTHAALLLSALAELQGQVADRLGDRLHAHRLNKGQIDKIMNKEVR